MRRVAVGNHMMEHEAIRELIPAYALGATDRAESAEVEAHVRRCPACRAILTDYQILDQELLYAVPAVVAPLTLAARLRHTTQPAAARPGWQEALAAPRRLRALRAWRMPALAGLLALLLLLLIGTNAYWLGRASAAEQQIATLTSLTYTAAVTLPASENLPDGHGTLFRVPGNQLAILCVYDLPPLPAGTTYQAWLVRGDQRDSGGLFQVTSTGDGILFITAPRPLRDYNAVGVTVEPSGGSPGPTSPRVIGGPI